MRRLAALLALAALAACSKPSADATPPAASTPTPAASSAAPVVASASSRPGAAATQAWHGTYKSVAATMTVPPDWKKVHWSDPQNTTGLGDGPIALTVDGASGHVSGTVDGPLGPATLDGVVTEGQVSATIRRKDANDRGFTGTLLGSIAGDHLEGTMNVSLGLASALRTATFTLSPGAAP